MLTGRVYDLLADTLAGLERALAGELDPPKHLPCWLPDGDPITTLGELAVVLGVTPQEAGWHVLDARDPPKSLLHQAVQETKDVYGGMPGLRSVTVHPELTRRVHRLSGEGVTTLRNPGRRKRRRIRYRKRPREA